MKKVMFFLLVGVIYVSVALGASWANNSGAVDSVIKHLGLQNNSKVASEEGGAGVGNYLPSNVPIPRPPFPPPNVNSTMTNS